MMLSFNRKNKQRGIGLLELMLSLSIIAILLVMAVRYYVAANVSQKINNAVSQVNGIAGAVAQYQVSNPQESDLSIKTLVQGNYLPASFGGKDNNGAGANPWLGNLGVQNGVNGGFIVTMNGVPDSDSTPSTCTKLSTIINNFANTKAAASCSGTTLTVNF